MLAKIKSQDYFVWHFLRYDQRVMFTTSESDLFVIAWELKQRLFQSSFSHLRNHDAFCGVAAWEKEQLWQKYWTLDRRTATRGPAGRRHVLWHLSKLCKKWPLLPRRELRNKTCHHLDPSPHSWHLSHITKALFTRASHIVASSKIYTGCQIPSELPRGQKPQWLNNWHLSS
jgi:hypothetical protein